MTREERRARILEILKPPPEGEEIAKLVLEEVFELVDSIHKISYNLDLIQSDLATKVFLHD